MDLIISLLAGAVGGNVGGKIFPKLSLGTMGNSVAGIVGGAALPMILQQFGLGGMAGAVSGSGMDVGSIVADLAGGAIGGTGAMAIVGAVKNMVSK